MTLRLCRPGDRSTIRLLVECVWVAAPQPSGPPACAPARLGVLDVSQADDALFALLVAVSIAWQHPRSGTQVRLGGGLGPDALVVMDSDTPVLRRERPEHRHAAGGAVADPLAGGAA